MGLFHFVQVKGLSRCTFLAVCTLEGEGTDDFIDPLICFVLCCRILLIVKGKATFDVCFCVALFRLLYK